MKIIGFNFTKISAEKKKNKMNKPSLNVEIKFTDLEKEKVDFLKSDDAIKISFRHLLNYKDPDAKKEELLGEVNIEGNIVITTEKEESKEIFKTWKKKNLPNQLTISLNNFILKKCSPKTLQLQDELNLPTHIPIPRISPKNN